MKQCTQCKELKDFSCFYPRKCKTIVSYYSNCKICAAESNKKSLLKNKDKRKAYEKEYREKHKKELHAKSAEYRKNNSEKIKEKRKRDQKQLMANKVKYYAENPEKEILLNCRKRAKAKNLEFNLTLEDIIIPEFCPILGIPLCRNPGKARNNSPCADRIDNSKGYVKGNVAMISHKANRLKSDMSIETVLALYKYMSALV